MLVSGRVSQLSKESLSSMVIQFVSLGFFSPNTLEGHPTPLQPLIDFGSREFTNPHHPQKRSGKRSIARKLSFKMSKMSKYGSIYKTWNPWKWPFFWLVRNPRCSMYGIFSYIWLKYMVNVGNYSIHGESGNYWRHCFLFVFGRFCWGS